MTGGQTPLWLRRTVLASLLGGLLLAGFVVLRPFLTAIAWAAILSYVSWPLHLRVLARLRGRRTWAALAMTVMLTLALGAPLFWLVLLLRSKGWRLLARPMRCCRPACACRSRSCAFRGWAPGCRSACLNSAQTARPGAGNCRSWASNGEAAPCASSATLG